MKLRSIFVTGLLLAEASFGFALPSKNAVPLTKGLPPIVPATKGLPPATPATKGLPAAPATKGLPPVTPATKGLPPETALALEGLPQQLQNDAPKIPNLPSAPCLQALVQELTNPAFKDCLPVDLYLTLLPLALNPDLVTKFLNDPANNLQAVEKPIDDFVNKLCQLPKCNDKDLDAAKDVIFKGCKNDLTNPLVVASLGFTVLYFPAKDTSCATDDKTKTLCIDEILQGFAKLPKSPLQITKIPLIDSIAVADPPNVCVDCLHKITVDTFFSYLAAHKDTVEFLKQIKIDVTAPEIAMAVKCGITFATPKSP